MKNILILGALPKNKKDYEKYNILINFLLKYSNKLYSPIDTVDFKGNDLERLDRAIKMVKETDLIVGELSQVSTGQGFENLSSLYIKKEFINYS